MDRRSILIIVTVLLLIAAIFIIFKISRQPATAVGSLPPAVIKSDEKTALFDSAQKALLAGDAVTSRDNLEKLIAKYPDSPQAENWYFLLGKSYETSGELLKSRDIYKKIIEKFPKSETIMRAQEAIDDVNIKIIFSSTVTSDSFLYEIQKGDTLSRIAKKFGTTIELISKANNIKDGNIKLGKKIKISKAKLSIVVDKSQNILTLKADNDILKTYRVSTGKDSSTPTGTFKITTKVVNPVWYTSGAVVPPESPKNILGSRWLGLSKQGYGIHGTTEPQSIGKSVTAGCVRMKNSEVEELYSIVPEGTEVVIID